MLTRPFHTDCEEDMNSSQGERHFTSKARVGKISIARKKKNQIKRPIELIYPVAFFPRLEKE